MYSHFKRQFSSVAEEFGVEHPRNVFFSTVIGAVLVLAIGLFAFFEIRIPTASADDVTTSVTVLNTPPNWTVNATESPASSSSTPTNSGSAVTFTATATDDNTESYYLLICKTSAAPTANSSAAPTCGGGISNQWAVSSLTASAAQATAATTTRETFPFQNEENDWFGWVCDANTSLPRCNASYTQGVNEAASPFVVNHPPFFTAVINDSPVDPGDTITWTATAFDNDVSGVADTVQLFVCRSNDFNGTYCGAGGSWATSTLSASNPATTTTIRIPTQDRTYDAYVYVVDNHSRVATSTTNGSNSTFVVNNVSPTLTGGTIFVNNSAAIVLNVANGTSGPFTVNFTATDNNSCVNSSSGNELRYAITNVFRSDVGSGSCLDASHYNSNSCYAATSTMFTNFLTCTQDSTGGNCAGSDDPDATWTCRYSLWYNASPTDAATPWTAENWLATVQISDDNSASSTLTQASAGVELNSFMAFNVSQSSVAYGGLEPGDTADPNATTTDLIALGNVGLDEDLYGDTMCTTWSSADSCDTNGFSAAGDIPVSSQMFATSALASSSPYVTNLSGSTTPRDVAIRVPKTTATATPQERDTYWGINIPTAITLAGNYTGQNTITAKVSNFLFW